MQLAKLNRVVCTRSTWVFKVNGTHHHIDRPIDSTWTDNNPTIPTQQETANGNLHMVRNNRGRRQRKKVRRVRGRIVRRKRGKKMTMDSINLTGDPDYVPDARAVPKQEMGKYRRHNIWLS